MENWKLLKYYNKQFHETIAQNMSMNMGSVSEYIWYLYTEQYPIIKLDK